MKAPVVVIIGRPNVGKSTLFNCLTKSRDAIVANIPGLTRDRIYGKGRVGEHPFHVIDTGGISGNTTSDIEVMMSEQVWQAVEEADILLWVVDGRTGLTPADIEVLERLRPLKIPVLLVVNKTDGLNPDVALGDFYGLGLAGGPYAIAASHKRGVQVLVRNMFAIFEQNQTASDEDEIDLEESVPTEGVRIAIVGRPNVGKSTLFNRILGENRSIVADEPGTTRDSLYMPLVHREKTYVLIDTAGIRKRARLSEVVEKFSVVKSFQAIENCNVAILLIDGTTGIVEQDLTLLNNIVTVGRALIIVINKWDGLSEQARKTVRTTLDRRLRFIDYARIHYISAKHGTGVGNLYDFVDEAYESATKEISTTELTKALEKAVASNAPQLVGGRRIKLRYAHMGGHNPPVIVIHGNRTSDMPANYKRYLQRFFSERFKFKGTPVHLVFKTGENPFEGKKNLLTPRQERKRKRMITFHKKKDKK